MYEVSNQFKEYCKRHIRTFKNATITYYNGDEQQTIESEEIIKFDISAEPYIDYQIIGQAVAKKIHISIKGSYDLANKEINVTTTMIYDDNTEEVLNLGNYIIASDYDSSVKNQCSFTGYDYMIKMDNEYSDEGLNYPCTIRDVLENICEQKDIELATTDLPNGDLEVIGNNFQDGATYRDVLKQIAQVNGTFAYIDRSNKLHIDQLMNHNTLQGEGTSITLSGTKAYGNIIDYMLEGNTTQNGTPTPSSPVAINNVTGLQNFSICGKNLYDKNNVTSTGASNQNIKFTTTLLPNTQYTFNITSNRTWGTIYLYDSSNTQTRTIGNYSDANKLTFTTSASEVKGDFIFKADTNVDVSTYDFTGVQLEKGTATTYEPYQGKDYEINLGANLLDIQNSWVNNKSQTSNGLRYILNEDDTISISGTSTNYSGVYARSHNSTDVFMTLKANHKYRLLVEISNKTSNINSRVYFGKTSANINEFSILTMVGNGTYYKDYMPTEDIGLTQYSVIGAQSVGETSLTMKVAIYDITTNVINKYIKYFTPIELNKIGNYQDFIRKGTGKNKLFLEDKSSTTLNGITYSVQNGVITLSGTTTQGTTIWFDSNIEILNTLKGKKATLTRKIISGSWNFEFDISNKDAHYYWQITKGQTNQIASQTKNVLDEITNKPRIYIGSGTSVNCSFIAQAEEGNSTDYEPFGYKDKWYIEKNIDNVVLNGTETWTGWTSQDFTNTILVGTTKIDSIGKIANVGLCNRFSINANLWSVDTEGIQIKATGGNQVVIRVSKSVASDYTTFKTWLQSNNTRVYYVLANPTYTLIENEELIGQLNALNNGYVYGTNSNISVSGNIPSIINISVDAPGRDVEDEVTPSSYLTDFKQSREYGPVNRVQITMTDIEDATYIENAESITKDGIQTITINDNYFLSSEELKAKAIRPLWNSLYTMKYMPISCKYLGLPYIEMNDYIGITLPNGDVTGTYVFNYKFTYDGGYMGELETPTISRTQETYPTESINSQVQKMGINVDRANARITSEIIARQETDENVTRIEQSIDEINLSVSTTQTDLTNLEGQVQTNTASIGVNADNISLAVEKNTQTQDQLDTLQTNTENVVNQLVFNGDGLTISALGSTSDDMKLDLTNEAINFMYNNNVVLKINGSTIEFANASFQKLDLGNYVWVAEDDDSLSLIYEGE